MKTLSFCITTIVLAVAATSAQALTVDESYAALKTKRYPFDARVFSYGDPEGESLQRIFALADQGVVLRAETLRAAADGNSAEIRNLISRYDALVASFEKENPPEKVAPIREKIVLALRGQRKFLAARTGNNSPITHEEFRSSPEMREASRTLAEAQHLLVNQFAKEPRKNLSAFTTTMRALDYF